MNRTLATDDRAAEISRLHSEIVASLQSSLEKALRVGELLVEQKASLAHGEFLPWLATLPFSDRTARRYMRLHRERDKLDTVTDLGAAYRLWGVDAAGDSSKRISPDSADSDDQVRRRPMPLGDMPEDRRIEHYRKWRDSMESSVFVMNQAGYPRELIREYCRCTDSDIDTILNPTLPIFDDWSAISDELGPDAVEWCIHQAEDILNVFKSERANRASRRAEQDGFPETVVTECKVIAEHYNAQSHLGRGEKEFAKLAHIEDPFMLGALFYLAGELARIANGVCTSEHSNGDSIAEKWVLYKALAAFAKGSPDEFAELEGRMILQIVESIERERSNQFAT